MDFGDRPLGAEFAEVHPTEAFAFEMAAAKAQTVLDFLRENSMIFAGQEPATRFDDVRLAVVKGPGKTFSVVNAKHKQKPLVTGLGSESIARTVIESIKRAVFAFRYYNALWGTQEIPPPSRGIFGG